MAQNDGKPDLNDVISPAEEETLIAWARAALIRAIKTAAQSAIAAIPTSALTIGNIDWRIVAGTAALAGVLSVLTSVAGVPEVDDGASVASITANK